MTIPTRFQNLNRKFSSDGQQQSALAQLGQLALSDLDFSEIMSEAAALIAKALSVEIVLIWELHPQGRNLSLKAKLGWEQAPTQDAWRPCAPNSLESLALGSPEPVVFENVHEEIRFTIVGSLMEHGVVSGAGLLVGTEEKPLGVLEIFAQHPHFFLQEDVLFLQGAASILGLVIDRKHLEEKNQITARSRDHAWDQQEIKHRLLESREKERLRLAQELHDAPIQDLYGFIYQLDDLRDILKDTGTESVVEEYNETLQRIVDSLRAICGELRPPSLSPFGLEVAIRDHVERFQAQNPNIQVHLDLMRDKQELSDSLRLSFFRIYQQAMNNIVRHAEATEVRVYFGWDADTILLEVEDNGKGFEVPNTWVELVRKDHFGLAGLAERVESIHGKLEIVSAPGHGTLVRALVPRH